MSEIFKRLKEIKFDNQLDLFTNKSSKVIFYLTEIDNISQLFAETKIEALRVENLNKYSCFHIAVDNGLFLQPSSLIKKRADAFLIYNHTIYIIEYKFGVTKIGNFSKNAKAARKQLYSTFTFLIENNFDFEGIGVNLLFANQYSKHPKFSSRLVAIQGEMDSKFLNQAKYIEDIKIQLL